MTLPYFVDHWYLWSDGEVRRRHYDYATLEEAQDRMHALKDYPGTTRIVLCKRGIRRNQPSTLKVIVT